MKIQIYDPPLCCSSGLCGPKLDPVLVKLNDALLILKKQGVEIERFNLSQQLVEVMSNKRVAELIRDKGKSALPVTFVNGRILRSGEYPTYEELCSALGIKPTDHNPPSLRIIN